MSINRWYTEEISFFERLVLTPLIFTTVLLGFVNLIVVAFAAPHNVDSMTYHLARVAYYLQHNNLNYFDANYWAQVVHPKNATLLLIYTYLVSGKNENLTQLVQFVSYWVAVFSVYAIARKVMYNKAQSIFAASISALLIEWLMEASTTQNDMIITAYFGAAVYFLFTFRETREWKYLGFAAIGLGLSVGTKASALLALPSVALIALYTVFSPISKPNIKIRLRDLAALIGFTILAILVFALPSGYIDNYRHFGNPFGPRQVISAHAFSEKSIQYILKNGTKNLFRFGLDFLSLDGLPPIRPVRQAQTLLRFC